MADDNGWMTIKRTTGQDRRRTTYNRCADSWIDRCVVFLQSFTHYFFRATIFTDGTIMIMAPTSNSNDKDTINGSPTFNNILTKSIRPEVSGTVSTGSSGASPIHSLAADPLSIIFSFLPVVDFLHTTRVCTEWRSVSDRPSAWPKGLATENYIDLLLTDSIETTRRPRLNLIWSKHSLPTEQDIKNNSRYRRATEIQLSLKEMETNDHHSLPWMPVGNEYGFTHRVFPSCTALSLIAPTMQLVDSNPVNWILQQHGEQLRFLQLECLPSIQNPNRVPPVQFDYLTNLRILVANRHIPSEQLFTLKHLEYLHLVVPEVPEQMYQLFGTVRKLSLEHSLRHLSLECKGNDLDVGVHLLYESTPSPILSGEEKTLDIRTAPDYSPARLESFSLVERAIHPRRVYRLLSHLTHLTSLTCQLCWMPEELILPVSRLKRLTLTPGQTLIKLSPSTTLETLHLVDCEARLLAHMVHHSFHGLPNLTDLSWNDVSAHGQFYVIEYMLPAFIQCNHLRRMDLSFRNELHMDRFIEMASHRPSIEVLEVGAFNREIDNRYYDKKVEEFQLPPNLLVHVAVSLKWNRLCVHAEAGCKWYPRDRFPILGPTMDEILERLADPNMIDLVRERILNFRLYHYANGIVQCFNPRVNRRGKFVWRLVQED